MSNVIKGAGSIEYRERTPSKPYVARPNVGRRMAFRTKREAIDYLKLIYMTELAHRLENFNE